MINIKKIEKVLISMRLTNDLILEFGLQRNYFFRDISKLKFCRPVLLFDNFFAARRLERGFQS